jgi:hypothetical protein
MSGGTNIYGNSTKNTFPNGIITAEIDALDATAEIDISGDSINFLANAVLVNGVPISGSGIQNPLTSNLNVGSFDVVSSGGLTLNGINTRTQNLSAVAGNTAVLGVARHQLVALAGDSFSVSDDGSPFSLLYFRVDDASVLSQIPHIFSQGLKPTVNEIGNVGEVGTRFDTLNTKTANVDNLTAALNTESKTYTEEGVGGEILKLKNTNTYYAGLGAGALMTGDRSVAIGIGASGVGTTNDSSTAVGAYACGNIQGLYNTGFGAYACSGNPGTTGNYNTCVGINAMRFTENMCDSNTVIGSSSGRFLDTADQNVIVGASSCGSTVNLNHNTCVGTFTEGFGTNSIALGHDATCLKDNQCVIGDASLAEIVPGGNGVCDLGSTTNAFKDVYMSGLLNNLTPIGGVYMTTTNGNVISGTVAEVSLFLGSTGVGGLTVPANAFSISSYHLNLSGAFSSNNGDTMTIRLNNSALLGILVSQLTGSVGESFEIEVDFSIRKLGGLGVAEISTNFDFTYSDGASTNWRGDRNVAIDSTTFSTLISNTLDVTVEFSSVNANNSIQLLQAILTKVY